MDGTKEYFKRLTEAEADEHARIEAELNNMVREGFTERAAIMFVVTVVAVRKIIPAATVAGIFDAALLCGLDVTLSRVLDEKTQTARRAPKRKTKRSGVRLET